MKSSVIGACLLAVVLWTGAQALGQGKGQGKGQGQGKAESPRTTEVGKAPQVPQAGEAPNGRPANKGGKGKQAVEDLAAKSKAEAGKKTEKAGDAVEKGKGKKVEQAAEAIEKGKAKGKGHQQQLQALDKQLRHEQAKHMERQARLARIRELAVQKGDAETIARVDKLIAKEQQVHGRKQQHIQGQKRAAEQPQTEAQQAPATPVEPPAEVGTPQPAPDANGPTQ